MSPIKVYITDRDDSGELLDRITAVIDGERLATVELAPHLTLLSDDGLTHVSGVAALQETEE
jgi:hypothetical protein